MMIRKDELELDEEAIFNLANNGRDDEMDEPEDPYRESATLYFLGRRLPIILSGGSIVFTPTDKATTKIEDMEKGAKVIREFISNIPESLTMRAEGKRGDIKEQYDKIIRDYPKLKDNLSSDIAQQFDTLLEKLGETFGEQKIVEPKKRADVEGLLQLLEYQDSVTTQQRGNIYRYWEEIFNLFSGGAEVISFDEASLEGSKNYLSGDVTSFEFNEEIVTDKQELLLKLDGLKLPNYVADLPPLDFKQYSDKVTAMAIMNKVIPQMEYVRNYDTVHGAQSFAGGYSSEEGAVGEVEEQDSDIDIEDAKRFLARIKNIANLDPLLGVEKTLALDVGKRDDFFITEEVLEEINSIKELFIGEKMDIEFLNDVYDLLFDDLDNYIKTMRNDIVKRNVYYLPVMDSPANKAAFMNLMGNKKIRYRYMLINVEKTEAGVRIKMSAKDDSPVVYDAWTTKVNKDGVKAFKTIYDVINIQDFRPYVTGESRETEGGTTIPFKGKRPIVLAEVLNSELGELLHAAFFEAISYKNLFGNDKPDFTKIPEYSKLETAFKYKGRFYSGIIDSLVEGASFLNSNSINNLRSFFDNINRWLTMEPNKLIKSVEGLYYTLIDIVTLADEGLEETRRMRREIKNFLGSILNVDNVSSESTFLGKPVSSYTEVGDEFIVKEVLEDIISLLSDSDFMSYAKNNDIEKDIKRLEASIRRSRIYRDKPLEGDTMKSMFNSYIEAIDTLRMIKNLPIYKAYLDTSDIDEVNYVRRVIQKENNVDLYLTDFENIIKSTDSFETIAKRHGISTGVVYKVKGLFR